MKIFLAGDEGAPWRHRARAVVQRAEDPAAAGIGAGPDALGRGGMDGRVNNFFWQRFGTALLFSLVEDAATVGAEAVGNSASNTTRVPSDAASTILQQNGQIKPVLRKNQGEDVGITAYLEELEGRTPFRMPTQSTSNP